MREDVNEEKRKRRNASSHLIERKENPVDRYFCHSVLPLCSVDRFCFLLSDLLKQIPQTPIRGRLLSESRPIFVQDSTIPHRVVLASPAIPIDYGACICI